MPTKLVSPYDASRPWLRGNLHAHTTNSDGNHSPQALVDAYHALDYDFLMISDHDYLTDPNGLDNRGMVLIPGNEVTRGGPHILHVGATDCVEPSADRQVVLDAIAARGGIAIVAHPNWEANCDHCPFDEMTRYQGYLGVEIYNGVVRVLDGNPLATDKWDRLLSAGRRVWAFAHDDAHFQRDVGLAWIMVQSAARDVVSICEAIVAGRFYASTGVTLDSIHVEGRHIAIEAANAETIAVVADHGRRVVTQQGPKLEFVLPDDFRCSYLRVECWGYGETMAWTQPFFVSES